MDQLGLLVCRLTVFISDHLTETQHQSVRQRQALYDSISLSHFIQELTSILGHLFSPAPDRGAENLTSSTNIPHHPRTSEQKPTQRSSSHNQSSLPNHLYGVLLRSVASHLGIAGIQIQIISGLNFRWAGCKHRISIIIIFIIIACIDKRFIV